VTRALLVACRTIAIAIAIVAAIDPAITSDRRTKPVLSVVAEDSARDTEVVRDIVRRVELRYRVVRAPLPNAAATVLLGARVPTTELAAPVVVVSPYRRAPRVEFARVQAPARAMLESSIPVAVTLRTSGVTSAQTIELTAQQEGRVVARSAVPMAVDSTFTVPLTIVPTTVAPVAIQLRAVLRGQSDTARTDVAMDVRAARWSVLFFDRRPSWMSTFVRRAIERDPRFAVTSRIVTSVSASTSVSRETGRAPNALDALSGSDAYDVIVVGAPDALTSRDVDALRTQLRVRGVSVLLLADHVASGPVDALTAFGGWRTTPRRVPANVVAVPGTGHDAMQLRGTSLGVPAALPADAQVLAVLRDSLSMRPATVTATTTRRDAVMWRMPVGLGEIVVSGAFDAWRFRDAAQSTFDATWRDLIDEAASRRQAPIDVQLSRSLVTPGADVTLTIASREARDSTPISAAVQSRNDTAPSRSNIALGPGSLIGQRVATLRAPLVPGAYHVQAARGADTVHTLLLVAPALSRDADNAPDVLTAWAHSRGGQIIAREDLGSLPDVLDKLVTVSPQRVTWHPMRSPWWIVPFALLLAAEWWARRRRGLP
jgi:hypothetical protein